MAASNRRRRNIAPLPAGETRPSCNAPANSPQPTRPTQGALNLAIDFVPAVVRAHGLQEAHARPLVSRGKVEGQDFTSWRAPVADAWRFPEIEYRTPTSWPAIVLDVDGGVLGNLALQDAIENGLVQPPNWITTRPASLNSHAVYTLARPVHRGTKARASPLRKLGRVSEYYARALRADGGYSGALAHNPAASEWEGCTRWLREAPYSLEELAEVIPLGWRAPRVPCSAVGRNVALFRGLMRWAGSARNLGAEVLAAAVIANQNLTPPLPYSEVRATAASVDRYRRQWLREGRFIDCTPEAVSARQRRRGRLGGLAKAKAHGAESIEAARPWEAEGISRRTWYRRKKATR